MLRLCFVYTALALTIAADYAGEEMAAPQSIDDFLAHQRDHCNLIVEHLNSPVDWHIALDVSSSYWSGQPPSRTVVDLLRRLPIEEKDSLQVDFFANRLQKSGVDSDWLRAVALGDAQTLDLQQEINRAVASAEAHLDLRATDVISSSQSLLRSHSDCAMSPPRTVVLVLTDGLHDPDGTNHHVPIFQAGLPPFFSYPTVRRERASFLQVLVDTRGIRSRALRTTVVNDWQRGRNLLRQIDSIQPGRAFSSVPSITIVNQDHQLRQSLHHLERQLGRTTGIFPCLIDSEVGESSSTVDREQSVKQEESSGLRRLIHLPAGLFEQPEAQIVLPILFYARGQVDEYLQLHITDDDHGNAGFQQFRLVSEYAEEGPWRIMEQYLSIPIKAEALRLHSLPWLLEVRSGSANKAIWTSFVDAVPGEYSEEVNGLLARFANATAIRGRLQALFAVATSFLAFVFLVYATTRYKAHIRLFKNGSEVFGENRDFLKFEPFARHLRVRYDRTRHEVRRVLRRNGPTVKGHEDWELDIIVFFGLVYVAIYSTREADLGEIDSATVQPLLFSRSDHDGLLYIPQSYWLESEKEREEPTSIQEEAPDEARSPKLTAEEVDRVWRTRLQPEPELAASIFANVPDEVRVLLSPGPSKLHRTCENIGFFLSLLTIGFTVQASRESLRLVSDGFIGVPFYLGVGAALILVLIREALQQLPAAPRASFKSPQVWARLLNNMLVVGAGLGPLLALLLCYVAIDSEDRLLFFSVGVAAIAIAVGLIDSFRNRVVRRRLEEAKAISSADWMWEFILGRWSLLF